MLTVQLAIYERTWAVHSLTGQPLTGVWHHTRTSGSRKTRDNAQCIIAIQQHAKQVGRTGAYVRTYIHTYIHT